MSDDTPTTVAAYGKALLHCMQYPTQPVMGFLIGRKLQKTGGVFVCDAVPVMHSQAAAAPHPIPKLALMQIAALGGAEGTGVVGAYVANERLDDAAVSEHTKRLMAFLVTAPELLGDGKAILWQFDNDKVTTEAAGAKLACTSHIATGSTAPLPNQRPSLALSPGAGISFRSWSTTALMPVERDAAASLRAVGQAVEARTAVADFEAHLDNPRLDYLNKRILAEMSDVA